MSEWKEYKLGEVCSFVKDKIPIRDVNANVYISTENMLPDKGGITLSSAVPSEGTVTHYYPETILISNIRPYFKKIWFSESEGGCSNDVLCFKGNDGLINSKFLYYLLSQDAFFEYVMLGSKGCKMPRGDKDHIMKWNVLLPPIDEQKRIAEVLSSLDDNIDLLNRENTTLEALAETLFRHYFIENPDPTWKEGKLTDFIKIIGGGTPKTSEPSYWNGNIGWLSGGDISVNHKNYILNVEKYITQKGVDNSAVNVLPENSMIISARGTVGKYCLLGRPMAFSQSNYGILPKINDCYYFTYLLVSRYVEEMKNAAYGSVFDTITTKTFESINVIMPNDKEEIVEFNDQVKPIFVKLKTNQLQIQTLSSQRDALLPRLMSGEVKLVE